MFDPVTNRVRDLHARRQRAERERSYGTCNMCKQKSDRLFNGRCIACETRIAQAIFHHQTPESDLEVKRLPKKREC